VVFDLAFCSGGDGRDSQSKKGDADDNAKYRSFHAQNSIVVS
jgi:hypothetical protein